MFIPIFYGMLSTRCSLVRTFDLTVVASEPHRLRHRLLNPNLAARAKRVKSRFIFLLFQLIWIDTYRTLFRRDLAGLTVILTIRKGARSNLWFINWLRTNLHKFR